MAEAVPNRAHDPKRKAGMSSAPATFACEDCGNQTPINQQGIAGLCDGCFDNRYFNGYEYECPNDNVHTGNTCGKTFNTREGLDNHWDKSKAHSG